MTRRAWWRTFDWEYLVRCLTAATLLYVVGGALLGSVPHASNSRPAAAAVQPLRP